MRKYILCHIGAIAADVSCILGEENIVGYLDVESRENFFRGKEVFGNDFLEQRDVYEYFFVICEQVDKIYSQLFESVGFLENENYISYRNVLLMTYVDVSQSIKGRPIAVYGTGNTYKDYREFLENKVGKIQYLIDGKKTGYSLDGIEVLPPEEGLKRDGRYFVVCSVAYPQITEKLESAGFRQLEDYIFVDTLYLFYEFACRRGGEAIFDNRQKGSDSLLIILSGYRDLIWKEAFRRAEQYVPRDFDVCVVNSGKCVEEIRDFCRAHNWSFLSTRKNNIGLAINRTIIEHRYAEHIYKMDEDIFLTKSVFERIQEGRHRVENESRYEIGFVSPMIPVNCFTYVNVLQKTNSIDQWSERFGEVKYTAGAESCHHGAIWNKAAAAEFMWGDEPISKGLAELEQIEDDISGNERYSICPYRFSIGLIEFDRNIWEIMEMFPVGEGSGLGLDEMALCNFCHISGRAMIILNNCIVGHLSYHNQTNIMKKHYDLPDLTAYETKV